MSGYMKRIIIGVCAALVMATGFVGCNGAPQNNQNQPSQNDMNTQPSRKSGCGCGR